MKYLFKNNKGFTLIEIVIVLFIAGLSVSLVALSINRLYESAIFKEELKKVYQVFKRAREMALIERAVFTISIDNGSLWLKKDGKPFGNPLIMPEGITLKGDPIIFFPKGNSSGGHIEIIEDNSIISKDRRHYIIEVETLTGRARLKRL